MNDITANRRAFDMLIKHSFWLSLLLHLSMLFSYSFILKQYPDDEKRPDKFVPAYVYHNETQPVINPQQKTKDQEKPKPTDQHGIEKKADASRAEASALQDFRQSNSEIVTNNTEPLHLIGDKGVDKPLLTLLGKALSAKLRYPKIAVDFKVRGVVLVGFTLYPDGQITNVKIMQTSAAGVLDEAALKAVNAMTPGKTVGTYLKAPKFLVVGIIFG